ncbi:hypothetical protein EV175_001105 [Coemansia sp. RSA 1933]|nr:hypothetical protein EV175_001105 [Coemansia sp. RSA 1933]
MRSSNLSSRSSYSTECKPNLPRPVEIDGGVWKSMQAKVNDDLSQNLYGLSFSMDDICRIGKSNHNGLLETTAGTAKTTGSQQDCDGTGHTPLKPLILPFMLGRFFSKKVIDVVSGPNGIVAIAFEDGAIVVIDCVKQEWNVTLLKLPDLNEEAVINIVNASGLTPSIADEMATTKPNVRVSRTGRILVTGKDGLFMQASIIDMRSPASADAASAVASEPTRKMTRTYFDIAHQLPPPPARKGITSWLFGKSANASADITAFLGSHSRDLIVNGATKPGERFMIRNEKATADEALAEAGPSGISKQTDSKIEGIVKDTELGPFSDMRMMAERRGQQLEELGDKTQRLTGESQKFLENIRAYNAKQKNKKLFGFF